MGDFCFLGLKNSKFFCILGKFFLGISFGIRLIVSLNFLGKKILKGFKNEVRIIAIAEDLLGFKFKPAKGCVEEAAKSVVRLGLV